MCPSRRAPYGPFEDIWPLTAWQLCRNDCLSAHCGLDLGLCLVSHELTRVKKSRTGFSHMVPDLATPGDVASTHQPAFHGLLFARSRLYFLEPECRVRQSRGPGFDSSMGD